MPATHWHPLATNPLDHLDDTLRGEDNCLLTVTQRMRGISFTVTVEHPDGRISQTTTPDILTVCGILDLYKTNPQ